jgi:hypothetical protein
MNMRPPVAQVTPAILVGFATAWVGLSLFLLPAGSGPLRSVPVGPLADLVTGPVVAALEPSLRPPAAPAHSLEWEPAALTPTARVSVSHGRAAARRVKTRAVRREIRPRVVPPPLTPVSVPAAPQAAATPRVHGKGKALGRVRGHSPPGRSQSSESGPAHGLGRSTEKEHRHGAAPPGLVDGRGNKTGHGGEGHGGGGR